MSLTYINKTLFGNRALHNNSVNIVKCKKQYTFESTTKPEDAISFLTNWNLQVFDYFQFSKGTASKLQKYKTSFPMVVKSAIRLAKKPVRSMSGAQFLWPV